MPDPSKLGVPAAELQRRFNSAGYYERMQAGEFTQEISQDLTRMVVVDGQTVMSEICIYRDQTGRVVAIVHQYRRHNGTLAASGKPDPKMIWDDGVTYVLAK